MDRFAPRSKEVKSQNAVRSISGPRCPQLRPGDVFAECPFRDICSPSSPAHMVPPSTCRSGESLVCGGGLAVRISLQESCLHGAFIDIFGCGVAPVGGSAGYMDLRPVFRSLPAHTRPAVLLGSVRTFPSRGGERPPQPCPVRGALRGRLADCRFSRPPSSCRAPHDA